jgi:hypothetical protein
VRSKKEVEDEEQNHDGSSRFAGGERYFGLLLV